MTPRSSGIFHDENTKNGGAKLPQEKSLIN